eukprot:SAG22_NODE_2133_length_2960_cov_2.910870_5_plen_120_part_00
MITAFKSMTVASPLPESSSSDSDSSSPCSTSIMARKAQGSALVSADSTKQTENVCRSRLWLCLSCALSTNLRSSRGRTDRTCSTCKFTTVSLLGPSHLKHQHISEGGAENKESGSAKLS